jgi:orotate phosphoribosyltransferase
MGRLRVEREQQRPRERPVQTHRPTMLPAMPDDLAERLIAASEIHGDFVLSSGRRSTVYFDKFRFLTDPSLLRETATAVSALLPNGITHLAAPEGAATLLVSAVALQVHLPIAVVRKEAKAYGTMAQVEGHAPPGAQVALIEDVSTTGHQVLAAAKALEAQGCQIGIVILAIDRGGAEKLREAGYRVRSVVEVAQPD